MAYKRVRIVRRDPLSGLEIDKKDIDTTEGGEASAEPLRSESKAAPMPFLNDDQQAKITKLIEHCFKEAGLSFEQEHQFRLAFRAEYTRLILEGGK